jgi:hypothetical protein
MCKSTNPSFIFSELEEAWLTIDMPYLDVMIYDVAGVLLVAPYLNKPFRFFSELKRAPAP